MLEELKKLCLINGASGDEAKVRDYIISRIKDKCEYRTDAIGNVIAFVKGKNPTSKKLMISAHMDEVGLIVTYINDDGTFCFSEVGGVDPRVVFGRQVRLKNGIYGVVGGKAVHNLSDDEKGKAPSYSKMVIDIGVASKAEAQALVALGDFVYFTSEFTDMGQDNVKCKAIDDRAGCAVMLRMIDEGTEYDTYFTFVTQEEVGLRGAACAAYKVNPDYAIVLESTTAADIPSSGGADRVCELSKGPVVSFMDNRTMYNRELYSLAFTLAEQNGIPCQTKTKVAGGNDAGVIHTSCGGVKTIAISVPCRYLHSPSCVISKSDFENTYRLTKLLSDRIFSL